MASVVHFVVRLPIAASGLWLICSAALDIWKATARKLNLKQIQSGSAAARCKKNNLKIGKAILF